ncbi:nucleoside phosphorylase [Syntrophotalea carbinolica DSM 2380]|uniref:Nucleoside phosphorylase n=1 Tax=Syntrophotalea carbinolica (strain DSM 2380 / NBRC 103641 / GraBd1) TaxID=338963 RepID=Q3A2T9_SYNC1|nr:nucleoside phosphorylase [Syntrophotalea carbinolica]ABA89318.1 nucleoside phosphorylase [Syntrophotalea carbinolica DSM 2380]
MISSDKRSGIFRPGMVVALPGEAKAMLGRFRWQRQGEFDVGTAVGLFGADTLWVRCGMGSERAARAAAFLIERGVTHVGIAGVSGALAPELQSGQLVLASEVVDEHGQRWTVDTALHKMLMDCLGSEVRSGRTLTTAAPLLNVEQKIFWRERRKALAVDMESAAVARVASEAGRLFFVLRAICDEAARPVSAALFDLVDEFGRPRPLRLVRTLCCQPSLVPELLHMQRDFGRALGALRNGWQACGRLHSLYDERERRV